MKEQQPEIFMRNISISKCFVDVDKSHEMETATTNQILSLVQHDLGIGFCPEALAKDYLDRGEIIEIPVKEHANQRDICLLTDSTRPIGIAGKKLLEILMDSEG